MVIFPAGRLARRRERGARRPALGADRALARPQVRRRRSCRSHLTGPWSTLFHFFDRFSAELRDITLFHELLNKRGDHFGLAFGPLIPPERSTATPRDADAAAEGLHRARAGRRSGHAVRMILPAEGDFRLDGRGRDRAPGRGHRARAAAATRRSACRGRWAPASRPWRAALIRALTSAGRGGAQPDLHAGADLRGHAAAARPLRPLPPRAGRTRRTSSASTRRWTRARR